MSNIAQPTNAHNQPICESVLAVNNHVVSCSNTATQFDGSNLVFVCDTHQTPESAAMQAFNSVPSYVERFSHNSTLDESEYNDYLQSIGGRA